MIFVSICVGSSCHLKGSEKLVELFRRKIQDENMQDDIVLSGSFCLGKCNREGVTVTLDDGTNEEIITGVLPEKFDDFWQNEILKRLKG